jgi:hypothetical protein
MPGFIGLIVGCAAALIIIIVIVILFSVKSVRKRVFPYRDRKHSLKEAVY